ncbi:30S ribosomal protein S9 [Methanonatronarchaeum sp. AMET6-2]|uniref:30S ribosomal protein S9 n=1 Tax=Methanonatronarchaeum sp. AMET6-2 TaxID=2933293 RepID=UPI00122B3E59|nr:30S ribosomal protein S9 [Methanonatronarchaeum sp. AMET6-2]RZN61900.1 MAG: 30S ribosomal protein S9 [Methanonatronarchaeia archaeon]UOY10631.1 30S ribosomal protein S9 [Methanonatronarchaeum sp. AMET6-2]
MDKIVQSSGKRKNAIARATLKEGEGKVYLNNKPLEIVEPELRRLRIQEPLLIAGEKAEDIDIKVKVEGGGISGQADAAKTAIARGLVKYTEDDELKEAFLERDRSFLINDPRQKERKKAGGRGARARRQKSYR